MSFRLCFYYIEFGGCSHSLTVWQGLSAILWRAEAAPVLGPHHRLAPAIGAKPGPSWSFGFLLGVAMDFVASIDIELVAVVLAGLVLVQLVLELNGIHRRSGGASRRGFFLQVQGRRLPAAEAGEGPRPADPAHLEM